MTTNILSISARKRNSGVPLPSDIVARLEADQLRAELATLVARYDAGSPAVYAVDIAWLENQP